MRLSDAARHRAVALGAVLILAATAGCSGTSGDVLAEAPAPVEPTAKDEPGGESPEPEALSGRLYRADILITSDKELSADLVKRIKATKNVEHVERLSVGSLSVEGSTLTVAAVDPSSYRRFTPATTAHADDVWGRVAGGEVAVDSTVDRNVVDSDDMLRLGDAEDAEKVHVGAYATLSSKFSAVVNMERGEELGLPEGNALLVSTGMFTPSAVKKPLMKVIGDEAALTILALEYTTNVQTALLTNASVSSAVGSFRYSNGPNGTIYPDQKWISTFIRTETVPILGRVTCNKAVFPQLRAALNEVISRGLADKIHPGEYAGCYYPRYIGRTPERGLSLHSWGIALDLNTPGNQRGTAGEMDRGVVQAFEKWGFTWGGHWRYTDPMHFELNRIVNVG